jgi:5'-phosphate synthase pdxT subunit
MDIDVVRNAFGRQVDSFETDLPINEIPGETVRAVFIRAPLIKSVGEGVKVLAEIEGQGIVAARQGRLLVTSFHPELTRDTRMHAYFLTLANGKAPE